MAQFEHTLVVTDEGAEILTVTGEGTWAGAEAGLAASAAGR